MMRARPGGAAALALSLLAALLLSGLGAGGAGAAERPWWEPADRPAPDSRINVSGEPFTGTDANGDVRGFVDTHNHLMANEAFGGKLVCGKPFSEGGIADALKDCPEHYPDGAGALLENLTVDPDGHHDPVGWPTFKDWPSHTTMSHQQNYYAWLERAWRAGQRVLVTDLTSNGVICSIYVRDRGCDEMESVRLQAQKTYDMQDYVDQMYGGAGKGWFRIVKSPAQARQVIEAGKLAVVLGVETSEPFGCKQVLDVAQCSRADIDAGLDELQALGVSSMFLCHKFDNALCGVRFDEGTQGTVINVGQFLSTGTFWKTEKCAGPQHDNPIGSAEVPEIEAKLPRGTSVPSYDENAQCNTRGLTRLGEYALNAMMDRQMMVEVDHMSVKAAGRAMDIMESVQYPGVISSHSWMDRNWTERLYRMGGFVGSYDMNSKSFVQDTAATADLREKYDVGLGYGTDFNGLGSHPAPRGADAPDKVTYPFRSYPEGPLVDRQHTGDRVWDVNTDGGAHVGLIPDWIEDVRHLGGDTVVDELLHGAQSYLDTWNATRTWDRPADLARSGAASAGSSEFSVVTSYRPDRAVDGNSGTRWASDWSDDQWWSVDLRSPQRVGRVVLDWEKAHAAAYRIEVSDDNRTWRTVWRTAQGRGGLETAAFTPTTARYLRVHGTDRATRYGYSLWEVAVHAR
ncbi:galactose-binding domain-containing protein [Streptomyces coelicoflavus]|uniref:galactose-binding domain-containing protein n=1 Tax=Streptomyces coelicoflavus TaxID=285562 RepID=UPI00368A9516